MRDGIDVREVGVLDADLEAGLCEAFPGLELVDRDLALGGGVVADRVAVDEKGRLVLVLFADSDEDACSLAALDALAWARANRALFARHLDSPRLRADLDPQVVVVGENLGEHAVARLGTLACHSLRLFELRRIESARGVTRYVVPAGVPAPYEPAASDARVFLEGLHEDLRETARLLVRRLERVDGDVTCEPAGEGLECRFRGSTLCTITEVDGQLEGRLPDDGRGGGGGFAIHPGDDFDAFLDEALGRYIALLDDDVDDPELDEVEIVPSGRGALLTAEEIEAFRT